MSVDLLPDLTTETAGVYSGILASSFMFGRAVSSYPWGRLGDSYGRKFVLINSLVLAAIFSLCFGSARSYAMALIWRFLLGLTNGIVGTVKTAVSEISPSKEVETKMMGKVVGMRSLGFLISPAIGGFLSSPTSQFPTQFGDKSTWYFSVLSHFPYLLPNVVGSVICLSAALTVWLFIPETLEKDNHPVGFPTPCEIYRDICSLSLRKCEIFKRPHGSDSAEDGAEDTPLLSFAQSTSHRDGLATEEMIGKQGVDSCRKKQVTMKSLWKNQSARDLLIPYWIFSQAVSSLDEAFPLFCIASIGAGGLELLEVHIGKVLSLSGLLFLAFQFLIYVWTVERVGLRNSMILGSFLGFFPVFFIPIARLLQIGGYVSAENEHWGMSWPVFTLLVVIIAVSKIYCCMFFTAISISLNSTAENNERASLNGLASLGGSVAKGIGPVLAGWLSSVCFSSFIEGFGGATILFFTIGCNGMLVAMLILKGSQ